jgi:two-component sensor histidine kinase
MTIAAVKCAPASGLQPGSDPAAPPNLHAGLERMEAQRAAGEAVHAVSAADACASLAQQDLLLREANHRVNNNLQLIVSLLRLQARRNLESSAVYEALAQAGHWVRATAPVHDHLQRSKAGGIQLAAYLQGLCTDLSRLLALPSSRPVLFEANTIEVPADRAVALGLIVTELVTNAHKHGQRIDGDGRIQVSLWAGTDGALRLLVADDGPGIPGGFGAASDRGLGMRLIQHLVHTLAGRLDVDGTPPGARFTLHLTAAPRWERGDPAPRDGAPCA